MSTHLCVDLGATSGRVMKVDFVKGRISLKPLGRFITEGTRLPADKDFSLIWDLPGFWKEIIKILSSLQEADSIAIDGWGVDFGLLDKKGKLMSFPRHYRDTQHIEKAEEVINKLGKRKIYEKSGIQIMPINTLYQIYALWKEAPYLLENSTHLLMIPDIFTYFFSGEKICEYTNATTTQVYSVKEERWAKEMLEELNLPTHYLLPVTSPGKVIGRVRNSLGFLPKTKIVATASHDTASAIVGTPLKGNSIYISSGTWSLVGIELEQPLINEKTYKYNFTNEGGVGKINFLKNITGMWILEECRREWRKDLKELLQVEKVEVFSLIDVDEERFQTPGRMPEKIIQYLKETGQKTPQTPLEVVRIILESLAFKYRWVIERIEELTGGNYSGIHIVGGGAKNEVLNQLVADITGKAVMAGPYEATTIGSAIIQMLALREINSVEEGREIVRRSFPLKVYSPHKGRVWEEKYRLFKKIISEKEEENG